MKSHWMKRVKKLRDVKYIIKHNIVTTTSQVLWKCGNANAKAQFLEENQIAFLVLSYSVVLSDSVLIR